MAAVEHLATCGHSRRRRLRGIERDRDEGIKYLSIVSACSQLQVAERPRPAAGWMALPCLPYGLRENRRPQEAGGLRRTPTPSMSARPIRSGSATGADAILRFNPKAGKFQSFALPDHAAGVRQLADHHGEVWGAESRADKLLVLRVRAAH